MGKRFKGFNGKQQQKNKNKKTLYAVFKNPHINRSLLIVYF